MINISHNHIGTLAPLNSCRLLQSLDASFNAIQQIDDLSQLTSLKVKTIELVKEKKENFNFVVS